MKIGFFFSLHSLQVDTPMYLIVDSAINQQKYDLLPSNRKVAFGFVKSTGLLSIILCHYRESDLTLIFVVSHYDHIHHSLHSFLFLFSITDCTKTLYPR